MEKQYESVFILTPVLSEQQMKDAAKKFTEILVKGGSEVLNEENWGLKKLTYSINGKATGFYNLIEFKANPAMVEVLETEYRRDEKVIRFLTVSLNKDAIKYGERRKKGEFNKKKEKENKTI